MNLYFVTLYASNEADAFRKKRKWHAKILNLQGQDWTLIVIIEHIIAWFHFVSSDRGHGEGKGSL